MLLGQVRKNDCVKLSSIMSIDTCHREAYLCSMTKLWNEDGLKPSTKYGLPINFRVLQDECLPVSFSSSGIFSQQQLENAIAKVTDENPHIKRVIIVDLLKEYHGFIDSIPTTFRAYHNAVNYGVKYDQIQESENVLFDTLKEHYGDAIRIISRFSKDESAVGDIKQIVTLTPTPDSILTEEKLVEAISSSLNKNVEIVSRRFPCADHSPPSNEAITSFIYFVQNEVNPETDWIHIHCHGGKGRSTTFSIMFDIMMRMKYNTLSQTSFPDMVKMHKQLGGINVAKAAMRNDWKQELAKQRYDVIKKFYDIALASDFDTFQWPDIDDMSYTCETKEDYLVDGMVDYTDEWYII